MKKKILFFLLSFLMLLSIGYIYLNNVLLSVKLKNLIIHKIEKLTDRKVSISNIYYSVNKGLILQEISVSRKDSPSKPLLKIQEISSPLLLAPIIQKKLIISPQITIKDASLFIKKISDKSWNISDILEQIQGIKKNDSKENQGSYSFLCKAISLEDSKIIYMDATRQNQYTETIEKINALANISFTKKLTVFLKGVSKKQASSLDLKANYFPNEKGFLLEGKIENIALAQYIKLFFPQFQETFKQGTISSEEFSLSKKNQELLFKGSLTASHTHLFLRDQKIDLQGTIQLTDASIKRSGQQIQGSGKLITESTQITTNNHRRFSGEISADVTSFTLAPEGIHATAKGKINNSYAFINDDLQISGDITAENADFLSQPQSISLNGNFKIQNSRILYTSPQKCTGTIILPQCALLWKRQQLSIKSPVLAEGLNIQIDGKKFFQGNFESKQTKIEKSHQRLSIISDIKATDLSAQLNDKKTITGGLSLDLAKIIFQDKIIHLGLSGLLKNTEIHFDDYQFKGSPFIDVQGNYNLDNHVIADYNGSLKFDKAQLKTPTAIKEISNLIGALTFKEDLIQTEKMTFQSQNVTFNLWGSLKNLVDPTIDIRIKTNQVQLQKISQYLPPSLLEEYGISAWGIASIQMAYQGPLKNFKRGSFHGSSVISEGKISSRKFPILNDLKNIQGKISCTNEKLLWDDIIFTHKGNEYTLTGQYTFTGKLDNFTNPRIKTEIKTKKWNAETDIEIYPQRVEINSLKGTYLSSKISGQGQVFLTELPNPSFDFINNFTVSIDDLKTLFPAQSQRLEAFIPQGILSGDSRIKGQSKDFPNYEILLNAQSQRMQIDKYTFTNNFIRYAQKQQQSEIDYNAHIYEGSVSLHTIADLFEEGIPFKSSLEANNLNLLTYRKEKNLKMSKLSGKANLNVGIKGEIKDIPGIVGSGRFSVKDGLLGEIAIVQGLVHSLNNVPGLLANILSQVKIPEKASSSTKNYITGAIGDFSIKNEILQTQNTTLFGSLYDLKIQGAIRRDQRISAIVYPNYSRFTDQNRSATEIFGSPVHLEITGTLKNPQYKPIINPAKSVEGAVNTTIDIFKGVGNIFEDLF